MKTPQTLLCLLLFSGAALCRADDPPPIPVAVVGFDSEDENNQEGEAISALLTALLSGSETILLVEREDLARILDENELTLSGAVAGDAAANIGHLTGAKAIITGRRFSAGEKSFLIGKCISTETGRVFAHSVQQAKGSNYTDAVTPLAEAMEGILKSKQGDFLARVETPEERIARLKPLLAGKELKPVYVSIPEQHLTRQVPDPASQVEIQKTLQDLGFPLSKTPGEGIYNVTGEAFSELAGRRGNLVACRARIEVQISSGLAGHEIKVDRETAVALDLAENIAAKSALQAAGSHIVERILPHLLPK